MSARVSVVLGTFNGSRYLGAALDSVLVQEGVDLEVVVVDDGSTDSSPEILATVARRDSRVRVIRQENAGLTRALARGCEAATGEYIVRQDDDDLSCPGRVEKLIHVLATRPEVAVATSWNELVGPKDEHLDFVRFPEGVEAGTEVVLEQKRNPAHGSVAFRKTDYEAAGGYRPTFYFAQDTDLWLRLAERGGVLFLPEVLYRVRAVDGSITTRHRAAQAQLFELARECRQARAAGEPEAPILERASRIRPGGETGAGAKNGAGTYFIGRMLIRNRDPRALEYMRRYVGLRPTDPKGWAGMAQAALMAARRRGEG